MDAVRRILSMAMPAASRAAFPAMKTDRLAAVAQSWGDRDVSTSVWTWTMSGETPNRSATIWARAVWAAWPISVTPTERFMEPSSLKVRMAPASVFGGMAGAFRRRRSPFP